MIESWVDIDWSVFHFIRPKFLGLFTVILLLTVFFLFNLKEEVKWKKHIAKHLQPFVIQKGDDKKRFMMFLALVITLSIGVVALSGPTWEKETVPGKKLETPVVVLLDLSQSMMATDIQPNRLERAKFKIADLLDKNPKARVALVGFAGTAHIILPLTDDYEIIKMHLKTLSPKIMPFGGSDLKAAFDLGYKLTEVTTAPATYIVFSDDFDKESISIVQQNISKSKCSVEILPFNTSSGANIPSVWKGNFVKNKKGKTVQSYLNTKVLQQLNSLENVNVHALTLDKSDVEKISKSISKTLEFKDKDTIDEDKWKDKGIAFVVPVAIGVLLLFRRGWVVFFVLVSLTSCKKENFVVKDLFFSKDYQGQKLLDVGNYSKAGDVFESSIRKGVAYYRAGNYEEAIEAFKSDTTAMGSYNLGLTYYKNGNYNAAQLAFGKAVELNPDLKDASVNQEIVQQLIQSENEVSLKDAEEANEQGQAKNKQNKSPEDLSGGGQEATKKDMEKERLEETTTTDIRKGKELEEVPDDLEVGKNDAPQKILMRKVDDDPALFLKRKFAHQVKVYNLKPRNKEVTW